jgi:hypothetical protein
MKSNKNSSGKSQTLFVLSSASQRNHSLTVAVRPLAKPQLQIEDPLPPLY